MPSTIEYDLSEGFSGSFTYHSVGECRAELRKFQRWLDDCIANDNMEVAAGADVAACPNRADFEERARAIREGAQAALDGIWATFNAHFDPKADVIDNLMNNYRKKWRELGGDLDDLQWNLQRHLTMDEWSSEGATEYKAALPTQQKAAHELEELCYRAAVVTSGGALINAGVFEAAYQSFVTIGNQLSANALKLPKEDFDFWSGAGNPDGCVSFAYYTRTSNAKANLEELQKWIDTVVTTRGEWSNSAQQVADDIPTVQTSVNNLKDGGLWPAPTAVLTAEANVDDQTGANSREGRTNTATGDSLDLNNHGGF